MSCYEDIDENNFVLFKDTSSDSWQSCIYCSDCIKHLLKTQWTSFIKMIEKLDCKATFKRILEDGFPSNFKDKNVSENEIILLFYDSNEQSPKYINPYSKEYLEKIINDITNTLLNE
jgi:hypothetical protein